MAAQLSIVAMSPSSVLFSFVGTAGSVAALKKSGASSGDQLVSNLLVGPLRTCLERSADWTQLIATRDMKIMLRWSLHPAAVVELPYTATAVQGTSPGVESLLAGWAADKVEFSCLIGPVTMMFEMRFIPSNQR